MKPRLRSIVALALLYGLAGLRWGVSSACAADPWSTYRGNPQRTANTDGHPGPAAPRVLWVYKSKDHFVAAPVPDGDRVFVSGLGAFNVATFYCLAASPKSRQRTLWTKTVPYLKRPVVSSPAVADGRVVFGDGMHETSGAHLHCLQTRGGLPRWELPVPGTLVHLEGTPTVAGGRVYTGAGAAGVLCLDLNRVTLDGKDMDLPAVEKLLARRWQDLLATYEADKKKDPDFAVPPDEDQLPRPAPRRIWQQGRGHWHVDAPAALAGKRVLVASAYLDRERLGDRALYSLDKGTGAVQWRAPLRVNPWGGPSVYGELVVVGGSSIGYNPKAVTDARGEVAAFALADGKPRWQHELPGGVLGSVALAGGLAVVTAMDGKVRAYDLASGQRRWAYDAGAAFFAAPAVAQGVVYAGDLHGVVHAVRLDNGQRVWKLDLAADPALGLVSRPRPSVGMIYGGPAVQGGRLFVATCDLGGRSGEQGNVVVCIGDAE